MCDQLQKSDFSLSGVESTSALLNVLVILKIVRFKQHVHNMRFSEMIVKWSKV